MMLSYQSIVKKIAEGEISIYPYNEANVGPASYDLTLGRSFVEVRPDVSTVNLPINPELLPPSVPKPSGEPSPHSKTD